MRVSKEFYRLLDGFCGGFDRDFFTGCKLFYVDNDKDHRFHVVWVGGFNKG